MRILFVSYDSGVVGSVTSEWVNDKLVSFSQLGHEIHLITNRGSGLDSGTSVSLRKIHSLSTQDYERERLYASRHASLDAGTGLGRSRPRFFRLLGSIFDSTFRLLAGSNSDGKWSWLISAFPLALHDLIRFRPDMILSTGGASASHVLAVVLGKLSKVPVIVELQDPFIGSEMNVSNRAMAALTGLERWVCRHASKVVLVTQEAAKRAKARNPGFSEKICTIYPGAPEFIFESEPKNSRGPDGKITFIHVGHLYGTRNLSNFFSALDQLAIASPGLEQRVLVQNVGADYSDASIEYRNRQDFKESPLIPRQEALQRAAGADVLILVQHSDSRSEETIPYKTYDYLNLAVPILAIVKGRELSDLIEKNGGVVANPESVENIKEALHRLLEDLEQIRVKVRPSKLNCVDQTSELLRLPPTAFR